MPLDFFRFPTEVRQMIYGEIFHTSRDDNVISPDQDHSRRRDAGKDIAVCTLHNGLAILQSCQQAYKEVLPHLYKEDNIYYFDDAQHGLGTIRLNPSSDKKVPQCDFTSMATWLTNIGERNRLKLRHVHLHFNGATFTDDSGRVNVKNIMDPSYVGVQYLVDAVDLLAEGHNLETFEISFADPKPTEEGDLNWEPTMDAFLNIFANGLCHKLTTSLSKLTSITEVRFTGGVMEWYRKDAALWQSFKSRTLAPTAGTAIRIAGDAVTLEQAMEEGHCRPLHEVAPITWSRPYCDQYTYLDHASSV